MEECKGTTGFTLVELMVGVAMLAVVAGIAVPAMGQFVVNVKTKSAARGIYDLFQHGRVLAVKEGRPVRVQFGDMQSGGTAFSEVLLVLTETDADGNSVNKIRERFAIEAPVKAVRTNAALREVVFTPQGGLSGSSAGVEVKNTRTNRGYALSVSPLGTIGMTGQANAGGCS